jgi:hypothetical protein
MKNAVKNVVTYEWHLHSSVLPARNHTRKIFFDFRGTVYKNFFASAGGRTPVIQSVVSHYTD